MDDLERTRQALADGTFTRLREDAGMSLGMAGQLYEWTASTCPATSVGCFALRPGPCVG
jgi:hypothetical protein